MCARQLESCLCTRSPRPRRRTHSGSCSSPAYKSPRAAPRGTRALKRKSGRSEDKQKRNGFKILHLLLSPALWSAVLAMLPIVTNQPKPKIIALDIIIKDQITAFCVIG